VCSYISTSPQLQNSGICYDLTHEYDKVLCSSITWVLSLTKFYHRICNTVCSCWFPHKPRTMNQLQNCFKRPSAGQSGVVIPASTRDLSLLQNVQPGHMAHTASYSTGTRNSFPISPRVQRPGYDADHSSTTRANIKVEWSYSSSSLYAFIACIESVLLSNTVKSVMSMNFFLHSC